MTTILPLSSPSIPNSNKVEDRIADQQLVYFFHRLLPELPYTPWLHSAGDIRQWMCYDFQPFALFKVRQLYLDNRTTIPPEISRLTELQTLVLQMPTLKKLPKSLTALNKLETLIFCNTPAEVEIEHIQAWHSLREIRYLGAAPKEWDSGVLKILAERQIKVTKITALGNLILKNPLA